jgi:hypothetical protein
MQKKSSKLQVFIRIIPLILVCFLSGCARNIVDDTKKYVIFNMGFELKYKLERPGTLEVEIPYEDGKSYAYYYEAFYTGHDLSTGETGTQQGSYSQPGTYVITAEILLGSRHEAYTLKFTILEPPDTRIAPDFTFDPNGAKEFVEKKRYVYYYKEIGSTYPIPVISYEGREIEYLEMYKGIIVCDRGDGESYNRPKLIGTYAVSYYVNDYINELDKERFLPVRITITVEIIEEEV